MRIALTGGASGIGAEVAKRLKAQNHEIVIFDIFEPSADFDSWIKTDMEDMASIDSALKKAEGKFDALVNNAGVPPREGEGQAEKILCINYYGLKQFFDGMMDKLNEGAAIVNTASRAGAMWRDNLAQVKALMAGHAQDAARFVVEQNIDATRAYNLSKEAVIVLTITETERLIAKGLRMNSVSPAAVSTDILEDFITAFGPRVEQALARVGRAGKPGEVADLICFLTSPASQWIKGQDILIDGGISALMQSGMIDKG